MASWITTKKSLRRQDAKSLHTKNQESDALGHPTGNMDIHWVLQCIITDVNMYKSLPQLVNASWILSSSFHTTIKFHSYHQPAD
jgi:gamma-glutamyltranspeptidase